jgi:hypothetical protein
VPSPSRTMELQLSRNHPFSTYPTLIAVELTPSLTLLLAPKDELAALRQYLSRLSVLVV